MPSHYNVTPGRGNDGVQSFILYVLGFFFPPVVPLIMYGCGVEFAINCLLSLLAYFPGQVHACYLVYKQAKINKKGGYIYPGHVQPRHPGLPTHHQPLHGAAHATPPPAGAAYVPGREPWEGQPQHQQEQHVDETAPTSDVKQ